MFNLWNNLYWNGKYFLHAFVEGNHFKKFIESKIL